MANDKPKPRPRNTASSGPGFEVIAVVIFAFVLIFVVIFFAAGIDTRFGSPINPSAAVNVFGTKVVQIWEKFIKPIFIVLDLILFGLLVFAIVKAWPTRPHMTLFYKRRAKVKLKKPSVRKLERQWDKISTTAAKGTPEALRVAVIEADTLVDEFLKKAGYEGEHIADRLSQIIPGELESLEEVWKAHRLRNNLVHAPGIVVTKKEADEALRGYHDFLKEIGAL